MSPARWSGGGEPEPPLPPDDFAERHLELETLPAGTILNRIHPRGLAALFFGPPPGSPPRHRWDAPDGGYGVCYLAEQAFVAFAETFLRPPGILLLEMDDLEQRCLARVRTQRELRLIPAHDWGLHAIAATSAICSGPYAVSQAWSAAFHAHKVRADGIRYRASHDDGGFAIALFDRAAKAVKEVLSASLGDGEMAKELGKMLDRYGVGLAG
ncbi:MAG TPA: RES family NAD+ phosphorylase [Longimicrobium sp.]|nr:RES family NAD+ phosphorylase [Longimicrobium sp.]